MPSISDVAIPGLFDALMSGNYANDGTWMGAGPPPAGFTPKIPPNYDDRTSLKDMLYAPTLDQKVAAFTQAYGFAPTGNALAVLGGGGGQPAPTPTAATIITDPVTAPPVQAAPQAPNPNAAPLNTPFTVAPPADPIVAYGGPNTPSAIAEQGAGYGGLGGLGRLRVPNLVAPDLVNRFGRDSTGQPSPAPGAWNTGWGNFRQAQQSQQGPMPMTTPALGRGWGSGGY